MTLRKAKSYIQILDPEAPGGLIEQDSFSCAHCNRIVIVEPGSGRERGICQRCRKLVCGRKACMDRCDPIEAKIERMEQRQNLQRSLRWIGPP